MKDYDRIINPEDLGVVGVDEVLTRGVDSVYPDTGLKDLMLSRRIKLYLGIDATSPDLHIGHTVPLKKLEQFRQLGHLVHLLFGGFTSEIGDPSDKTAARKKQTPEQVKENMATYLEQASKVLNLSSDVPSPVKVVNNADWLAAMSFRDVVELASNFSVQQIEVRDMFQRRREEGKPIFLHEFMYPLMQAADSVELDVDVEVGGSDQIFNMLLGRTLVKRLQGHEKWVLAMKLIMDSSGKRKMGKSEGNALNVQDLPERKMESLMQWPDATIGQTLEQLTSVDMGEVRRIQDDLPEILLGKKGGGPIELKKAVSYRVIRELDGSEAANFALEEFERVKQQGRLPRNIPEVVCQPDLDLRSALVQSGLASDMEDANAKIKGGTIFVDGRQVRKNMPWEQSFELLGVGKRPIRNIRRIKI